MLNLFIMLSALRRMEAWSLFKAHGRDNMVSLSVQDTGPGIAEDEIPSLFERFYRGDKARARHEGVEGGGAGLGLAIAQGLAQAQGGHISVESMLGHGATFTLYSTGRAYAG